MHALFLVYILSKKKNKLFKYVVFLQVSINKVKINYTLYTRDVIVLITYFFVCVVLGAIAMIVVIWKGFACTKYLSLLLLA
jgi:hypothetical protein